MNKRITSSDNKDIKKLIKLAIKPRLRKESKSFVVEGKRELEMAFSNGYIIKKIYCNPNIVDPKAIKSKYDSEIIEVNNDIYSKISFRSSTEGIVAIVFQKDKNFKLDEDKINLALVLDGIERLMNYNVFRFGNRFYIQRNGTAMGTNVGCMYATIYFSYHKETVILKLPFLTFYRRLIDDAFLIIENSSCNLECIKSAMNDYGPADKRLE